MVDKTDRPRVPGAIRQRWRFAVVLVAALLLAVAQPLMSGLFDDEGTFDVFFSLLIAAVMLLVFEERQHRRIAISLGLLSVLVIWAGYGIGGMAGRVFLVGSHLLAACVFTFALYGIVRTILARQTSGDAIFGAVCGYLLLGIIWTLLYSAVETAWPGSFYLPAWEKEPVTPAITSVPSSFSRDILSYYSFITLATVGYGDVTPRTPLARTLAWIEAITGQFYLAILVAGLVGFKVTQAMRDDAR
jgi:voltage-gated potassium channel